MAVSPATTPSSPGEYAGVVMGASRGRWEARDCGLPAAVCYSSYFRGRGRPQKRVNRVGKHREKEVEHEDRDERGDERFGGRPADALRPGPTVEAAVTRNQRQHPAEHDTL